MFVIRLLNHPMYRDYWFSGYVNRCQAVNLRHWPESGANPVRRFRTRLEAQAEAANIVKYPDAFYHGMRAVVEEI